MASGDSKIWLGRDGQKYGPYSEASIRQWMLEGKVPANAMAWRSGMATWVPFATLLAGSTVEDIPSLSSSRASLLVSDAARETAESTTFVETNHPFIPVAQSSPKANSNQVDQSLPSPQFVLQPRQRQRQSQRKKSHYTAVLVVGAAIGLVGYFGWQNKSSSLNQPTEASQSLPSSSQQVAPVASPETMTDKEIQDCETYANITVRSMSPLAQIYGANYVSQKVQEKLEANLSPACLSRLAHEWSSQ